MKVIDETGNKYNNLIVLERDFSKKGRKYWLCQCQKCKEITSISGTDLRTGRKNDCPKCSNSKNKNRTELIGLHFGSLTVLDFAYTNTDRHLYWKCKCACGEEEIIRGSDLTTGKKQCCTKCNKENRKIQYIDEVGNVYGKLTVLEYDKEKSGKNTWWKCKCECGNIISVQGTKLRFGHTRSCGCLKSKGEFIISQILNENNIPFKTQITFPDCKDTNLLRFDFGIYNSNNELQYLIEYDGEQHFYSGTGWNTPKNLKEIQKKDSIKNEYCKSHNIPLLRIPYSKYTTLSIKDLLL